MRSTKEKWKCGVGMMMCSYRSVYDSLMAAGGGWDDPSSSSSLQPNFFDGCADGCESKSEC